MRILHAVRSDAFAGVERHVASLAAAQARAGHRVAVVGGDPTAMRAALGPRIPHRPAATVAEVAAAVRGWRGGDVVHAHMTAAEIAVALAAPTRAVVATRHFAGTRGASRAGRLAEPALRRRIAAQIAISRYVADHVDGPSTVVPVGVPDRPDGRPAVDRARTVLLAQRLAPEKDGATAVRAFAFSGLAARGWGLDVAGRGTERATLERLAARLGVADAVTFLGPRSDVGELMARAGVLLAPCPVEGLGLAVLEAMAAGLPVVAAAAGGHLETVGTVDGAALFAPGEVAGASAALAALAADPARRDAYAAELRLAQRTRFTLAAQVAGTDAVYRSVL
ncbi:glycosyltransferase family 4 protein [Georgenia daeguensis]|uniref:Glycosyltransferase family 1 protein n=1 Tax=Georgenia daeguensis TaxID=908355 RepID=A0ABP8EUB4_9MICO